MHIWLDVPVVTTDGVTAGYACRLLVHPASWKVLAIAVRRGSWMSHEVAVPLEAVKSASPKGLWLTLDRTAFHNLAGVRASEWQRPPKQWVTPLGWAPGRVYWPAGYDGPVYPEITKRQLLGWGTLRAACWTAPRTTRSSDAQPEMRPLVQRLVVADGAHLPELVADRLELELERQRHGESLLDVDPYDVLARPSECGFTTAYERDDASVINPQPRPDT